MKKATIRDIAREAGVSAATVSYVLNNREDQKIKEETRQKILQIVNLLNYIPNKNAKSLATNRSYTIAFRSSNYDNMLSQSELLLFIDSLSTALMKHNYILNYLPNCSLEKVDNADALICYNLSSESFYALSNANMIPLISVDAMINDPLFYQINDDYSKINTAAKEYFNSENFTFLSLGKNNTALLNHIKASFQKVHFCSNITEIIDYINNPNINIAISNPILSELCKNSSNVFHYSFPLEEKTNKIIECINLAINRTENQDHNILV